MISGRQMSGMSIIFTTKISLLSEKSLAQYDEVITRCRDLFLAKTRDYGTAWRILRLESLTDQIYIKAKRIRSIQQKGKQRIEDGIDGEFVAIVNYGLMALIQLQLGEDGPTELEIDRVKVLYDDVAVKTRSLFDDKNHDYGEAWRDMRVSSMTDLILMKILRIKQIEDNEGEVAVSEGVEGNYQDIINYAIFALIKLIEND
jgi:Nucleotide modification associated domain 1